MIDWDEIKGMLGLLALIVAFFMLIFVAQIVIEIPERGLRSVLLEKWECPSRERD